MSLSVVILAAGQGSRMKSSLPKVLHQIAGKALLSHVLDAAKRLNPEQLIIVYGHGGAVVQEHIKDQSIEWVHQEEQLGTGHAVRLALPLINENNTTLVLYGDVPLIGTDTLCALLEKTHDDGLALLTCDLDNPQGYGRIIRDVKEAVVGIIEQKDASDEQLKISEVNTGILALNTAYLNDYLGKIGNQNAQGEYYLTDAIGMHAACGRVVRSQKVLDPTEVEGVNTKVQLARLERQYQQQLAETWMEAGVILADPTRVDGRGQIEIGRDTFVDINVIFEGQVSIGENCHIEANCIIRDSKIADNTRIKANSVIEGADIASSVNIGPFARLRPGTVLRTKSQVGNFVEVKNSTFDESAKAGHLAYIGDATIGKRVNIGAGTITCNYDGANKHPTVLGNDVFVGSDTQFIAPVSVGDNATIGAGSTVTHDVPADNLVISRTKQKHIAGWKRPKKKTTSEK